MNLQDQIAELKGQLEVAEAARDNAKLAAAEYKYQRDKLLEITWLDLPGEPHESTCKWREEFNAGWERRAVKGESNPRDREYLQRAAKAIDAQLPDGFGFILFTFPTGTDQGRITYTANCDRKDCIAALKEWLLRQAPEEWLKHVA